MKNIFLTIFVFALASCTQKKEPQQSRLTEQEISDRLTDASRNRVQKESQEIEEFIKSRQFKTENTGTGLRIQVYARAKNGVPPAEHEEVQIVCKVFLLDGTLCYEADTTNPIAFRLGEGIQIRGLEEGIMKMIPGESARLVIPNHLAYGLSGDGDKIPPGAALYIDVTLLKINK
ncbi:MAG: FKBP-type peptidyl-prolyl cis-trans isomerase [Bacteroidota bacterium]